MGSELYANEQVACILRQSYRNTLRDLAFLKSSICHINISSTKYFVTVSAISIAPCKGTSLNQRIWKWLFCYAELLPYLFLHICQQKFLLWKLYSSKERSKYMRWIPFLRTYQYEPVLLFPETAESIQHICTYALRKQSLFKLPFIFTIT